MSSTREERPRHYRLVGAIGLPLGLLFLVIALNRPNIANMPFHDIFFLLTTGICLGSGLAGLIIYFVHGRKG
jgi:formate-dependent nitrite reductase membrane component NrfD